MDKPFSSVLGLPALRPDALWFRAVSFKAPVLISANALSCWGIDGLGLRHWTDFNGRHLGLLAHHPVALDSAGFVAASRYCGFPWSTRDYLDLAAAAPWLWWASQDWCMEPEVAADEDAVLDRTHSLDPEVYLRHVLEHIADHPVSSVGDLLPWNTTGLHPRLDQCIAA